MNRHARPCVGTGRVERGTMAGRLRLQDFGSGGGAGGSPDALILILFAAGEGAEQASAFARQWQPTVPRAAFVGIELDAVIRRTGLASFDARLPTQRRPARASLRRSFCSAPARPAGLPL